MQSYDVFMLLVLGTATLLGALRGMAWQVASLASIVLSSFVALRYCDLLAPYISDSAGTSRVMAMLILYLVTSFAVGAFFRYVSAAIERVKLKGFDRQLGAVFGAAKGALLCLVITFFAVTMSQHVREQVLESRSGPFIATLIHRGEPLLPKDVHDAIGDYLEQLDRGLDPTLESLPKDVTAGDGNHVKI